MLLKNTTKLDEKIIRLLADSPGLDAEQIHTGLAKGRLQVTLRAIFKALRNLQDGKVVIKVGASYSLRLSWAVELRNFADSIFKNYRKRSLFYTLIPPEGRTVKWNFPDFPLADDFWRQVALSLFDHTGEKSMYYWIEHVWFQLPSVEQELRFQQVLRSRGNKIFIIVEGNTYLDRSECESWPQDPYSIAFNPSPFRDSAVGSLSVVGDYVVTLGIDKYTRTQIHKVFTQVKSAKDLDLAMLNRLLQLKGRCSLRLEHNPVKARRLTLQFEKYFANRLS